MSFGGTYTLFLLKGSATGQDLYNLITEHLGLAETIFFGLMIIKGEKDFHFKSMIKNYFNRND